jgi:hypothetical protein
MTTVQNIYKLFQPITQNVRRATQDYVAPHIPQAKDFFFKAVETARTPHGMAGIIGGLLSYVKTAKARVGTIFTGRVVQYAATGMGGYTLGKATQNFRPLNTLFSTLFK